MAAKKAVVKRHEIDEQTLPHSLEAERAVLGAILLHNGAYDRAIRHVTANSFFRDAHRRIFLSMARLLELPNGAVDLPLLRETLQKHGDLDEVGGVAYLAALVDGLPRGTNIEHYAAIVKDKALLRACIFTGNRLVADAYIAEDPANQIIAAADQAIVELQHGARSERMRSLASAQSEFYDDLEWRVNHKGQLSGLDTGFAGINEMTLGWQAGDLIVVAARPSIGKTTFVINSAFAGAEANGHDRKHRVAVFSMEMRRRQLEYRIAASLTGIDLSRILQGYVREDEWPAMNAALLRMREADLHIDDTASRTVSDIRAECRRLKSESGLDLVVVDYIQLMPGSLDRRGATRNEEVTHISRTLKVLADDLSVPILVLSQLSRAAEGRADPRPKLSDLRESGALEQDADIVLFLHRKHHRLGGTTQAIFEKQRNGATGTVNLTLTRETCTFTDGGEDPPPQTADELAAEQKQRAANAMRRRAHSH